MEDENIFDEMFNFDTELGESLDSNWYDGILDFASDSVGWLESNASGINKGLNFIDSIANRFNKVTGSNVSTGINYRLNAPNKNNSLVAGFDTNSLLLVGGIVGFIFLMVKK